MEIPPTDVWLRERAARLQGHVLVAGVDEAGRGPLAGPVVAAAVLLPMGVEIPGINDSKLLPPEKRAELAIAIRRVAVGIGVGQAEHDEIDIVNIAVAGRLAMLRAVAALELEPDYLLIDGFPVPECSLPQEAMVKGRPAQLLHNGRRDHRQDHPRRADERAGRGLPRLRIRDPLRILPHRRMPRL